MTAADARETERQQALERWAEKALESAPPLTDAQRARLGQLLGGSRR